MIWPWSKILRLESRVRRLEAVLEVERDRAASWKDAHEKAIQREAEKEARFRELVEVVIALKRDGFQPPAQADAPPDPGPDLPPDVADALRDVTAPGTTLWHVEARRAAEEVADGKSAEEVAEAIRRGGTYEPWM